MKKILSVIFLFSFVSFHLSFASPALAYTQTGCTVGNYVCTGTVGSSTCVINPSGYGGNWQPSAPTEDQAKNSSNCATSQQFTSAGGSWFVQSPAVWQQQTFGTDPTQMDANKYGVFMTTNLAQTIIAALGGVETTVQTPTGMIQQRSGGAIGILANLTGAMYTNPPASSVEYLADVGSNLGLVKPAYAQGLGFNNLSPLLRLWKIFRDLTYLIFVIIFVVIGFMVMFRKKIDPRTVVTVQESLPQIVVALIVVTFSYAIIGLLVDAMQFLSYIIVNTLLVDPVSNNKILSLAQTEQLLQTNIFQMVWKFWDATADLGKAVSGVVLQINPTGNKIPGIGGLTDIGVNLIFKIALFSTMFKIFFTLLSSYINVILATIFSPIQASIAALPGGQNPLSWVKSLLANLLIFPATLMMIILAFIFSLPHGGQLLDTPPFSLPNAGPSNLKPDIIWSPPLLGDWTANGAGGLGPLISFGILMAIPAIDQAIKQALEIKESALGAAGGQGIRGTLGGLPLVGGLFKG